MVKNQFKENEMSETKRRAKYTLEFKLEAVRLVKGGQAASVTAKILGIPKASLENWVRLSAKGELKGAGDKPVNPEQMELARLRAELARVKAGARHLEKSHGVLRAGVSVKYAWTISNRAHWSITVACDILGVSASGYFEHGRRKGLDN